MTSASNQHALETDADLPVTAMTWRCAQCGTRQADEQAGTQFCESCGRPRIDIEWSRRVKRIGLIFFGIAIQGMTGAMIFLVPPGASAWAWVIYLGVGLVGFLHMFIGIELSRRDGRKAHKQTRDAQRGFGGLHSHRIMGFDELTDELPLHARRCPACDCSLIETIDRGRRRCPDCGRRFNLRELGFIRDDPAGELHAASPHETRLSGGTLVATLLVAAIVTGIVLVTLLALTGSGGAPGP